MRIPLLGQDLSARGRDRRLAYVTNRGGGVVNDYAKPLPDLKDPVFAPFWEAARQHRLVFQRCDSCGYVRWPAAALCPECLSEESQWQEVSGRGTVWSYCIYFHCYDSSFRDDIPYNVALVELESGPRLISNVIGLADGQLVCGLAVEEVFDDVTPEVTIVKFRPRLTAPDDAPV